MFEYQLGNIPTGEPADLSSHYNQLNLNYRYKSFRATLREEYFLNKFNERRYINITQYNIRYKTKSISLEAGHLYEMLGNGLLLRAYEIPGTVFEDQGYRVRHGFYRDIEGFKGSYTGNKFHIMALRGMPLINVIPPTQEKDNRREDVLTAINTGYRFAGQSLDLSYLRNNRETGVEDFASINVSGVLPLGFSYNTELAREMDGSPVDFGSASRYAAYFSLTYSSLFFGGSFEWKTYQDFVLGSGFNDPPTLVKEHSYKVLNRTTHVPLLINEKGYQLEMYYRFESGQMITFNNSLAVNELWRTFVFREYFAELYSPLGSTTSFRVFIDYAQDEFENEPHRYAAGGIVEKELGNKWSTNLELEYQYASVENGVSDQLSNAVFILGLSKASKISGSLVWELSTDPEMTDDIKTLLEIETGMRHWIGANLTYKINRNNTIHLFGGQRRGGPSCTSGICYEVLDFTGLEIRINTKF